MDSDDERYTPPRLADLDAESPHFPRAAKLPPLPAYGDEDDEPPQKRARHAYDVSLSRDQSGHGSVKNTSASSARPRGWMPGRTSASFYRRLGEQREVHPRYFEVHC